jgi:DNA-directed RNA polymerase I subunit RPA1
MNISHKISSEIDKVEFSFYSPAEIYKISKLEISNPQIMDNLGHPALGGLYDSRLGPNDFHSVCKTCNLDFKNCPGHFGHIDLIMPVYNPLTFKLMFKLLQSTCFYCHSLKIPRNLLQFYTLKLKLITFGFLTEAAGLDDYLSLLKGNNSEEKEEENVSENVLEKIEKKVLEILNSQKWRLEKSILKTEATRKMEKQILSSIPSMSCGNCGGHSVKFRQDSGSKIFQKPLSNKQKTLMMARGKYFQNLKYPSFAKFKQEKEETLGFNDEDLLLLPVQVAAHLYMMWEENSEILDLMYGTFDSKVQKRVSSPDVFFIEVVPVPPNKFRPMSKMGDMTYEHPQNTHLSQIIKDKMRISDLLEQEKRALEVLDPVQDPKTYDNTKKDFALKTIEALVTLQNSVNSLIDNSKSASVGGSPPPPGIRQILEKKEGLFRKHMMGKRVNYAARSVISPDPYIETSEIGVCFTKNNL